MEKAFDRVWHDGLLYKLSLSSAPRRLVQVVSSFLANRRYRVSVEDAVSEERPIAAGVPQGSCLSPACYAWFTDDIPVAKGVNLALYADDSAYWVSQRNRRWAVFFMQRQLNLLPQWLQRWRMSVNVAKTQALLSSVGARQRKRPLTLNGQAIEWSSKVKYLGVTIDRRLTMRAHVKSVVQRTRTARAKLGPVLRSKLPLRSKLGIYKAYIRPILTYAAPAWYRFVAQEERARLRAQQSLSLRTIVAAPWRVRNADIARDLKMESLDDFVERLTSAMYERAARSSSILVRELVPLHARPPDVNTPAVQP